MKITINGMYKGYPVTLETEAAIKSMPGIVQELLDVGITPPESLSEFVKQVDARGNRPVTTETNKVSAPLCSVHRSEMRAGNKGGFYCSRKNADGTWCDERVAGKGARESRQDSFITEQPINHPDF